MCDVYLAKQKTIYDNTPNKNSSTRSYSDLDWRLDVEIGRRAIHHIATPQFSFRIDTSDGSNVSFVADSGQVLKMKESLEEAIRENAGTHSSRFQRYCN